MFCISGCTAFHDWSQQSSFGMAASDLNPDLVNDKVMSNPGSSYPAPANANKSYLGLVVKDSEGKCSEFVNHLVLQETTSNTGLDIITTVFSALATVFTPLNTVHALTAGASIASGSKTAIDADIFGKATVANYAQAIQATYYTDIDSYLAALNTASDDKLIPSIEVSKIVAIHKECALASAQSTISQTMLSATGTATQNATTTVTVKSLPPTGTNLSVTATSSSLPGSPFVESYSTTGADASVTLVAQHLASKIGGDQALKGPGITASSSGDSVIISWPSSLDITWSSAPATYLSAATSQSVTPTGHPGAAVKRK